MDDMEVDKDVSTALSSPSGMKRSMSPQPSPIEKRQRPDPQQTAINDKITRIAGFYDWQTLINGYDNDSQWRNLFSELVWSITNRRIPAILPPQSEDQSIAIANNLTENELKSWKDGVQKGLKEGDWMDFITQREYPMAPKGWTAMKYSDSKTSS